MMATMNGALDLSRQYSMLTQVKQERDDKLELEQQLAQLTSNSFDALQQEGEDLPLTFLEYLEAQNASPLNEDQDMNEAFDPSHLLDFFDDKQQANTLGPLGSSPSPPSSPTFIPPPPTAVDAPPFLPVPTKSAFSMRILGVPQKSRVETQLKLCVQLVNRKGTNESTWKNLFFPENLIVSGKKIIKKEDKIKPEPGFGLMVEAGVVCSSNHNRQVLRCFGCIQRERKSVQRKKKNSNSGTVHEEAYSIEEEQKKILQFYCNSEVDFSCGEAIIPARITCYCRHHEEKNGFQIWISFTDIATNEVVAHGLSSQVMITDDHKSNPQKKVGTKRPRTLSLKEEEEETIPEVDLPLIEKVIPSDGPITGGIEVTILGKEFKSGLSVLFGENEANSSEVWGPNTILCVLPPSISPGSVPVTFKRIHNEMQKSIMFTYKDESDRMMMELALQVVGMKLTGKIADARQIAMKIVNSNQTVIGKNVTLDTQNQYHKSIEDIVLVSLQKTLDSPGGFKANIELQTQGGQTLLMFASLLGSHSLVKFLLKNGSDVNTQDRNGLTALHFAAMNGYQGVVRVIIQESQAPINLNLKDRWGRTAKDLCEQYHDRELHSMLTPAPIVASHGNIPSLQNTSNPHSHFFDRLWNPKWDDSTEMENISPDEENPKMESVNLPRQLPFLNICTNLFFNYRVLLFVGMCIVVGGLMLSGITPWHLVTPNLGPNTDVSNVPFQSTGGEVINHKPPPNGIDPPSQEESIDYNKTIKKVDIIQTPHYWIALGVYFLLSVAIVSAVVYKYRTVWKIKTVVIIMCIVFIIFGLSQVVIFIWE